MKASEVWKQRLSLSWLKYNLSTNGEGHLVQKSSSLNALSTLALSTRSEALTPKPIRSSKSAAHLPATNVADTSDAQLLKALKTMENQIRSMKVHYGILAPDDSVLEKQLSMSAEEGEMPTTTHDSFISALTDKDCGSELHKSASTDSIKRLDVTFQSEEMPNIAEEEGEEEEGEDNDDGLHGNGGDAAHEMMNTAKLDGDLGRGEGGGDEDSDRVVSVKLALMPKSPEELCELFQVKSPGIFTGGEILSPTLLTSLIDMIASFIPEQKCCRRNSTRSWPSRSGFFGSIPPRALSTGIHLSALTLTLP